MLGFLYRILVGSFKVPEPCKHNWETIQEFNIKRNGHISDYMYVLRCKHCGDIKQKTVG